MAGLRVFVSSTCFDLDAYRVQMRSFLERMGHEPLMSDHADVFYDPRVHTHTSCVRDVPNADVLVVLIGGRFGGTIVAEALEGIDFDYLEKASKSPSVIEEPNKLSITQVEVLKAIESGIPVYAFVDSKVYADHSFYQLNKAETDPSKLKFNSISKPETARYIFEFINFLRHRLSNNAIIPYSTFSDIEQHLARQWSLLFQALIREQRQKEVEIRRTDIVIDKIESLKAVVLQSISSEGARDAAVAVIKYRPLVDFLLGISAAKPEVDIVKFKGKFKKLMDTLEIEKIANAGSALSGSSVAILKNGDHVVMRFPHYMISTVMTLYDGFQLLGESTREAVFKAVQASGGVSQLGVYKSGAFDPEQIDTSSKWANIVPFDSSSVFKRAQEIVADLNLRPVEMPSPALSSATATSSSEVKRTPRRRRRKPE